MKTANKVKSLIRSCFFLLTFVIQEVSAQGEQVFNDEVIYEDATLIHQEMETSANEFINQNAVLLSPELAQDQLKNAIGKKLSLPKLPPRTRELLPEEIFKAAKNSTVIFGSGYNCGNCDKTHIGASSGYIISEDGLCVTNYHVVDSYAEDPKKNEVLVIRTSNGKSYQVAEILAADKVNDLAVVRLDTKGEHLAPLPFGKPAREGTSVYVLSHPSSMFYYFTNGMVARNSVHNNAPENHPYHGQYQMAITADYARGSSGGPVLDQFGNLVGTVSSTHSYYYDQHTQEGLQMVVKNTIPVIALKKMLMEN